MTESSEYRTANKGAVLLRALRPALPAIIGAAALTFLFAALMPMAWVAAISWNLYLDRLAELFVPPVGNGARLALALGLSAVAALIAGFIALLAERPDALRRRSRDADAGDDSVATATRRRSDFHPDDAPRPPLRAGRELPAGGLGPLPEIAWADASVEQAADVETTSSPAHEAELAVADAGSALDTAVDAPWLQPAELPNAAHDVPDASDKSLGAMVARFELGLTRRRDLHGAVPSDPQRDVAMGARSADNDLVGEVDVALEAALGTLSRMNRHALG